MFTSFFGNPSVRNPLSIAGRPPEGWTGPQYRVLAPKLGFFNDYKAGRIGPDGYEAEYRRLVLAPLDPGATWNLLTSRYGEDVVLLCHEAPGEFCHRRLVARWLEEALGVIIPELTFPDAHIRA